MSAPTALVLGVSGTDSAGWAIARALQAEGAQVAVTTRPARLAELAPLAEEAGLAGVWGVDADQPDTLAACLAELGERWGGLDALVHTWMHVPSSALAGPLSALRREDFDATMGPGVYGFIQSVGQALPLLQQRPGARVLTLSSACRGRMTPRYHAAGIAKAALAGVVVYLAQELGPLGIACNALSFGFQATGGAKRVVGEDAACATVTHLARKAPLAGGASMDDIGAAAAWLCLRARGITAETIEVDGGFSRRYF